jgi:PAS domain S-box-containing protein
VHLNVWLIVAAFALFLLQVALIAGLLAQNVRRRKVEEQLRRSERRYRLATAAGLVGVWDLNLETGELSVDPRVKQLLGYEDHEVANFVDNWRQLVHPDDRATIEKTARMYLSGALPAFEVEHRMLHRDGSVRWFLTHGTIAEWRGSKPVQMAGTETDVTQHKLEQQALRESEARAHALAGRLISAQEAERTRIARELHDNASQRVAVLSIGLGMVMRDLAGTPPGLRNDLQRLQDHAARLGDHIRVFSHELHPGVLQRAGLIAALREHCAEVAEQHSLYIDFHANEVNPIATDSALCLYRAAQETLHNIAKHAHATRVDVGLRRDEGALELTIADDGIGFDPAKLRTDGGLGLISLEERVRLLDGTLTLEAGVNKGTRVRVRLPDKEQGEKDAAHSAAPR